MRKCANCYFFSTNAIFLVCSKNFLVCREKNLTAVQTFAAFWRKFLTLMAQVLPPFGWSFAVASLMLNF